MDELEKLIRLALMEAAGMNEADAREFVLSLMRGLEDITYAAACSRKY